MIRIAFLMGLTAVTAWAAEEESFVSLFNGRDLSGWVNVNCAPETWSVRDGMIHCTGKPTGALRTVRQYENYILELDWRHLSTGGNSGVFIWATPIAAPGVPFLRGIEVQVLDNGYNARGKNEWYTTHGDVFPIHGATMQPFGRHNGMRSFPSEEHSNSSPQWNHYRIVCTNGVIRLSVNGKQVSGGENCNYRKGYLGLESEGGPVDFRNIRLAELPSNGAPADLSAPVDLGWRPLFTGLDLRGWTNSSANTQDWNVRGEVLAVKPRAAEPSATLWTDQAFGNVEFVIDCRPAKSVGSGQSPVPTVHLRGHDGQGFDVPLTGAEPGKYHRLLIAVQGSEVSLTLEDKGVRRLALPPGVPAQGGLGLSVSGGGAEFMNIYVRDL